MAQPTHPLGIPASGARIKVRRSYYFAATPEELLFARGIKHFDRTLWAILDRFANRGMDAPSRAELAEAFDCSTDTVDRALDRLAEHGWLTKERVGREVTFVLENGPSTPDREPSMAPVVERLTGMVAPSTVRTVADSPLRTVRTVADSPTPIVRTVADSPPSTPITGSKRTTKRTSTPDKPVPDVHNELWSPEEEPSQEDHREDVETLCNALADHVKRRTDMRPKITDAWRTAARRLLDLGPSEMDGVNPVPLDLALKVLDHCQHDDFWAPNVRAMPKFRQQWVTLLSLYEKRGKAKTGRSAILASFDDETYDPRNLT